MSEQESNKQVPDKKKNNKQGREILYLFFRIYVLINNNKNWKTKKL